MTLVALPFAVVSYTTCELVTSVTVTPGGGTVSMCVGWEKEEMMSMFTAIYWDGPMRQTTNLPTCFKITYCMSLVDDDLICKMEARYSGLAHGTSIGLLHT